MRIWFLACSSRPSLQWINVVSHTYILLPMLGESISFLETCNTNRHVRDLIALSSADLLARTPESLAVVLVSCAMAKPSSTASNPRCGFLGSMSSQ
jgi:hypothetical protein